MQANPRPGHTRIAQPALRHALEAVAAGAFGVRRDDVHATLQDDAGKLGVDLLVRLPPPPLLVPDTQEQQSAFERASIARLKIASLGQRITGLQCGRINIRLGAGGRAARESRVDQADRLDHRQDRRKP